MILLIDFVYITRTVSSIQTKYLTSSYLHVQLYHHRPRNGNVLLLQEHMICCIFCRAHTQTRMLTCLRRHLHHHCNDYLYTYDKWYKQSNLRSLHQNMMLQNKRLFLINNYLLLSLKVESIISLSIKKNAALRSSDSYSLRNQKILLLILQTLRNTSLT